MATKRLFVGIRVNPELQPDLRDVVRKLRVGADKREFNIRWSRPENWHITLKFLGPVTDERLPLMRDRLEEAARHAQPLILPCAGIGGFPEERRTRVICAGVARTQQILDLQTTVESAFAAEGFVPENREYNPHVTLGRLRNPAAVGDLISPFVRHRFHDLAIDELVLYDSVQSGPFTVYQPLHLAKLAAVGSQL